VEVIPATQLSGGLNLSQRLIRRNQSARQRIRSSRHIWGCARTESENRNPTPGSRGCAPLVLNNPADEQCDKSRQRNYRLDRQNEIYVPSDSHVFYVSADDTSFTSRRTHACLTSRQTNRVLRPVGLPRVLRLGRQNEFYVPSDPRVINVSTDEPSLMSRRTHACLTSRQTNRVLRPVGLPRVLRLGRQYEFYVPSDSRVFNVSTDEPSLTSRRTQRKKAKPHVFNVSADNPGLTSRRTQRKQATPRVFNVSADNPSLTSRRTQKEQATPCVFNVSTDNPSLTSRRTKDGKFTPA
jgi:hypothetical protein